MKAFLPAFAALALVATSTQLVAKGRPDWSNQSSILPGHSRGGEALSVMGSQAPEVARRNGMSVAELTSALRRDRDLHVDRAGFLHFVCEGMVVPEGTLTATGNQAYSAIPNSTDAFKLHSLPGSQRVIYLDFTGHTTSGMLWNSNFTGGADIVSTPFDTDASPSTFSTSEQDLIKRIWARVAEEYAPFAVDVTTEDPGVEALRRTSGSDAAYGVRVVISPTSAWYPNAGGVAYVGSFSYTGDLPCFVFSDKLGPNNEKYVAEAIAHEAGHTLGLSHDGKTDGTGYYQGHGSWAPIMGVGYYRAVTQWSKGEYSLANNKEDDLAVIALNGAPLGLDDNGNSPSSATSLVGDPLNPTAALVTAGIIEKSGDLDVFAFDTGAGALSLSAVGSSNQPNLDIVLELLDSAGSVVASSNPTGLSASLSPTVNAGSYFVRIGATGYLDPLSTGYSSYASLGEYVLTVNRVPTGDKLPPLSVASASALSGTSPLSVQFSSSGSSDPDGTIVSYAWTFGDGANSTVPEPSHVFSTEGVYQVVLSVTDNDGFVTASDPLLITVSAPVNLAPIANIAASATSGMAPFALLLDGSGSIDSDGSIVSHLWTFGDGTTSTAVSPSKTYSKVGSYVVTLKVTDNQGATASASLTITVAQDANREFDLAAFSLTTSKAKNGTTSFAVLTVLDRLGRPVPGVTVAATWSGKVTGNVSAVTDGTGKVSFTSKAVRQSGSATLTVKSFSQPDSYLYNGALNTTPLAKTVSW